MTDVFGSGLVRARGLKRRLREGIWWISRSGLVRARGLKLAGEFYPCKPDIVRARKSPWIETVNIVAEWDGKGQGS